jgi:putative acetyltransferase
MKIREETGADAPEIAVLTRAAFGGSLRNTSLWAVSRDYEVSLIEKLRAARLVIVSLVADQEGAVVGHILFSELAVELNERRVKTAALAPMAVRSDRWRRGIGSQLVQGGLKVLRERGYDAVIVLGHPDNCPRIGFSPSLMASFVSPFIGKAFIGLELVNGFGCLCVEAMPREHTTPREVARLWAGHTLKGAATNNVIRTKDATIGVNRPQ